MRGLITVPRHDPAFVFTPITAILLCASISAGVYFCVDSTSAGRVFIALIAVAGLVHLWAWLRPSSNGYSQSERPGKFRTTPGPANRYVVLYVGVFGALAGRTFLQLPPTWGAWQFACTLFYVLAVHVMEHSEYVVTPDTLTVRVLNWYHTKSERSIALRHASVELHESGDFLAVRSPGDTPVVIDLRTLISPNRFRGVLVETTSTKD